MEEARPVIYVIVNKRLNMSAGKLAAQACHASAMSIIKSSIRNITSWSESPHKTMIILEANDEEHLRNAAQYLRDRGIETFAVIDEGVNEVDPHSLTAVATTILNKSDERVQMTMSSFKKYRDTVRVTLEVDR